MSTHGGLNNLFDSNFTQKEPLRNPEKSNGNPQPCIHTKGTLIDLGEAMHNSKTNNSKIFAGYTYLGQFIDHDIVFSLNSNIMTSGDASSILSSNITSPTLDLSSVYDLRGFNFQLGLKQGTGFFALSPSIDKLGNLLPNKDLPRDVSKQALIPDLRNDENLLVAQIHVLFLKLHNYYYQLSSKSDSQQKFDEAKTKTISDYQSIVVHDFLKTILREETWNLYFDSTRNFTKNIFYKEGLPIEFTGAAFRFGHAMVRNSYKLQKETTATLFDLFHYTGKGKLNGKDHLPESIIPNLKMFFRRYPGMQLANEIRPHVSIDLPHQTWPSNRLAIRNLFRGQTNRIHSAQNTWQKIKDKIEDDILLELDLTELTDIKHESIKKLESKKSIQDCTPLWFFILLEADEKGRQKHLGPLASMIVAETFFNLFVDKSGRSRNLSLTPKSLNDLLDLNL